MPNGTLVGIMRDLIGGEVQSDPERWAGYVESQLRLVGYVVGPDPTWHPPCGCRETCGDDGDIDGPGTCKGLQRATAPPLVEVVMVPRDVVFRGESHPLTGDGS